MNTSERTIRFAMTYVNRNGMRTLACANQGRNFHNTMDEAKAHLLAMMENTDAVTLRTIFGDNGWQTLEVRPVECYGPDGDAIGIYFIDPLPKTVQLKKLLDEHCGVWLPVAEFLPPERINVVVMVRGDNCPAYGWLKFHAGVKTEPYFVVPQRGVMRDRGTEGTVPDYCKGREDVTHWWSPSPAGLPNRPSDYTEAPWGLGGVGWVSKNGIHRGFKD